VSTREEEGCLKNQKTVSRGAQERKPGNSGRGTLLYGRNLAKEELVNSQKKMAEKSEHNTKNPDKEQAEDRHRGTGVIDSVEDVIEQAWEQTSKMLVRTKK